MKNPEAMRVQRPVTKKNGSIPSGISTAMVRFVRNTRKTNWFSRVKSYGSSFRLALSSFFRRFFLVVSRSLAGTEDGKISFSFEGEKKSFTRSRIRGSPSENEERK